MAKDGFYTCKTCGGEKELGFILKFVEYSPMCLDNVQKQLRSLWTAYCIHNDLEPGTQRYDRELAVIWGVVNANCPYEWRKDDAYPGRGHGDFEDFMCEELV